MREQLIKLAENRGFTSKIFSLSEITSDLNYFLWLGELQKWLRDNFEIDITIMILGAHDYDVYIHNDRGLVKNFEVSITPNNFKGVYEEVLERGLVKALKLI